MVKLAEGFVSIQPPKFNASPLLTLLDIPAAAENKGAESHVAFNWTPAQTTKNIAPPQSMFLPSAKPTKDGPLWNRLHFVCQEEDLLARSKKELHTTEL